MSRRAIHLLRNRDGLSAVEFALIAPVFLLLLLGVFDLGYTTYIDAQLQGTIQKVARDSTIEGASVKAATLDARITDSVHLIVPQATLAFSRRSYSSFSGVGQPEDFTDLDGDGVCNNGEPFEDANGNGAWDADRGSAGFGGARDAILYKVDVTYHRPFPVAGFLHQSSDNTLKAATVLRNQPYSKQVVKTVLGNCP